MPTLDIVEEKREDEPSPPAPTPAGGDGESGPRAGLRPRLPRAAAAAPAPPREKAPSAPAPRSAGTWSAAWDAMLAAGWRWTRAPVGGSVLYVAPSCANYARDELLEYAKTDLSAVRRGRDLFETLGDVQRHAREVLGHEWDEEGGCRTMRLPRSLRLADSRAPNPAPPAAALPEGAGEEEGETVFVTVPPGSLGVTVHTSGPSFGVVELVQATCKFADSVSRGDRIATVDGRKVGCVADLTFGSGGERIVGIVKRRQKQSGDGGEERPGKRPRTGSASAAAGEAKSDGRTEPGKAPPARPAVAALLPASKKKSKKGARSYATGDDLCAALLELQQKSAPSVDEVNEAIERAIDLASRLTEERRAGVRPTLSKLAMLCAPDPYTLYPKKPEPEPEPERMPASLAERIIVGSGHRTKPLNWPDNVPFEGYVSGPMKVALGAVAAARASGVRRDPIPGQGGEGVHGPSNAGSGYGGERSPMLANAGALGTDREGETLRSKLLEGECVPNSLFSDRGRRVFGMCRGGLEASLSLADPSSSLLRV